MIQPFAELRCPCTPYEDFHYGILSYKDQHGIEVTGEIVIQWPTYPKDDPENAIIRDLRIDCLNSQFAEIFTELQTCGCDANPRNFQPYKGGIPWC